MKPRWPSDDADTVNVSGCKLTEVDGLERFQNAERLFLSHNELRAIPAAVAQLPRLKLLDLRGNPLEEISDELARHLSLSGAWFDETQLTRLPAAVSAWPLTKLSLQNMPTEFAWADALAHLDPTRLGSLSLGGNPSIGEALELVGQFTELKVLHLNGCGIRAVPASFAALTKLETLSLHDNELVELSDAAMELPSLVSLVVSQNPGTRAIKASLKKRCVSYSVS